MLKHFPKNIVEPTVLVDTEHFLIKLAENHEEVERAQRLRFEVFNVEQGRGLKTAEKYGIDFDEFDEYCLHLIALDKRSDKVIGTYRAHLGCIANSVKGFYSSREYEIHGIYKIADQCLELGRTCVAVDSRNGIILGLLWKAISELLTRANLTYMLGCVSLEVTDSKIGWAVYEHLRLAGCVWDEFRVEPRPGFRLKRPNQHEIKKVLSDRGGVRKLIPPLFKGYLRLGARICGEPALDEDFGSIDFFIMLDARQVPKRYTRHFEYKSM